ncbi:MAG: hypothetical protein HQL19_01005 [Candidatus Omnitrophica bacterium]|nr:hypothetical protein [Candidatus Omnitrophota bacterium]
MCSRLHKSVRHVSVKLKHQVYAEYGIVHHNPGEYEVDHLISLELGGSNDIANFWSEAADPQPGLHQKDEVGFNYGACPSKSAQLQATDRFFLKQPGCLSKIWRIATCMLHFRYNSFNQISTALKEIE